MGGGSLPWAEARVETHLGMGGEEPGLNREGKEGIYRQTLGNK